MERAAGACSTSYSSSLDALGGRRHTAPRLSRRALGLVLQPLVARTARLRQAAPIVCTALDQDTASAKTPSAASGKVVRLEVGDAQVVLEVPPLAASAIGPPRYKIERAVRKASTLQELYELVTQRDKPLDQFTTPAALYRLAKLHQALQASVHGPEYQAAVQDYVEPTLAALRPHMLRHATQMDAWGAAMALWAYGALGHMDQPVFNALCKSLISLGGSLRTVDCANVMYCFGHLGHLHKELAKVVVQTLLNHLDECKPHELSTSLWAFAKLRCSPDPNFMEAVVDFVQYSAPKFGAQELSTVLYALGQLGYRPQVRFLQQMEHLTLVRLPHLGTQDIANSAWAFAKLQYKAVLLLDALPEVVLPRLGEFRQQELSMLLYAYTAPRHYHRGCLDALLDALLPSMGGLPQQDVSTMVWALGSFGHRPANPAVMPALTAEVAGRLRTFKPVGLALVAKAFARLGWRSEAMLRELTRVAEGRLPDFRLLEVAHLLYGLAQLRYAELPVYYAAVRRAILILEEEEATPEGMSGRRLSAMVPCLNSISSSCQAVGYVPYTLIDYAESKGLRIRQPLTGSGSMDEWDAALPSAPASPSSAPAAQQQQQQRQQQPTLQYAGSARGFPPAVLQPRGVVPGAEDSWGEDYWEGDDGEEEEEGGGPRGHGGPNGTFAMQADGRHSQRAYGGDQSHATTNGMAMHAAPRPTSHQRQDAAVATSPSSASPSSPGRLNGVNGDKGAAGALQ